MEPVCHPYINNTPQHLTWMHLIWRRVCLVSWDSTCPEMFHQDRNARLKVLPAQAEKVKKKKRFKRRSEDVGGYLRLHRPVHGGRLRRRVPIRVRRLGARRHRRLLWFGLSGLRRTLDVLPVSLISLRGDRRTLWAAVWEHRSMCVST